jgi:hypothetical protein
MREAFFYNLVPNDGHLNKPLIRSHLQNAGQVLVSRVHIYFAGDFGTLHEEDERYAHQEEDA